MKKVFVVLVMALVLYVCPKASAASYEIVTNRTAGITLSALYGILNDDYSIELPNTRKPIFLDGRPAFIKILITNPLGRKIYVQLRYSLELSSGYTDTKTKSLQEFTDKCITYTFLIEKDFLPATYSIHLMSADTDKEILSLPSVTAYSTKKR